MSDIETSEAEFSLADLASLDVSDIAEVRFESLPAGKYRFRGIESKLEEGSNKDGEKRFIWTQKYEVVEAKQVLDRKVDKEELVGKKHSEKRYIVPEKAVEGIGQIRAFLADIGLPNEGNLGGVEGTEPGVLDGIIDYEFDIDIVQKPMKGDPTQKMSNMKTTPAKKR